MSLWWILYWLQNSSNKCSLGSSETENDFMFTLTQEETNHLRFVNSKHIGAKYLPNVCFMRMEWRCFQASWVPPETGGLDLVEFFLILRLPILLKKFFYFYFFQIARIILDCTDYYYNLTRVSLSRNYHWFIAGFVRKFSYVID
jgi:hypothetical protein